MTAPSRDAPAPRAPSDEGIHLATLLEVSQALSTTPNLKGALHRVLELLARSHGMLRGIIVLAEPETGHLTNEASHGMGPDGQRARHRTGEGITRQVVESGRPIVVLQASREPRSVSRSGLRPLSPGQETSCFCVPLLAGRRALGALAVDLQFEPARDTEAFTRLLGVIGSQVAQAISIQRLRARLAADGPAPLELRPRGVLPLELAVAALETDLLVRALEHSRGNRAKAARLLETTERIMSYKVRKYGIEPQRFR